MFENKKICRTCLTSEHELLSIFASVETGTRISDYFKLYLNHSLDENDGLSQKICLQCIHKILEVKKFYCQIQDSEEHLRRQIERVKSSTTEIIGLFEEDEIKSEGVSEVSEIEGFSYEETNSDDVVEYAPVETTTFLLDKETSFVDIEEDPLEVEEFKCSLCNETFKYAKNLNIHIKRDHNDEEIKKSHPENTNTPAGMSKGDITSTNDDGRIQWSTDERCSTCGRHFNTRKHLIAHLLTHSENRKRYPCHICEKTFFDKPRLAFHLWTHTVEKPFHCDICRKRFTQKNALVTHMTLHTRKTVKCPLCDKCFSRPSLLKVHIREHADERPYECDMCSKRYKKKAHLVAHQYTHCGIKPFSCKFCDKCFRRKSYLQDHIFVHIGRPYKCPACVMTFVRPHKLGEHLVNAHGIYEEPMKYKQQFNTDNDELKECEQVILEADLVEMDDQAFLDEETSFVDIEKEPLKVDEFKCSLCDETFKYEKNLIIHIKRNHSDEEIEKSHSEKSKGSIRMHADERPYVCEICTKRFRQKSHLSYHQYIHSGAKPFSCETCGKCFSRKSYLKQHNFVHVGRPYKCPACVLTFIRPHSLREHLVSAHGIYEDPMKYKLQIYTNNDKLKEGEQLALETDVIEIDDEASLDEETSFVDVEKDPLEVEEFKCSLCEETFKYEKDLIMHIKRDHSDGENEKSHSENTNSPLDTSKGSIRKYTDEGPYECDICLRRYKKTDHLVAHQNTHFEIKPFSCKFCGKGFKQKSYLRDHIFVHIGRPYKCPECVMTFERPHKLREHLVSVHGIHEDPKKYKQRFNINKLKDGEQVIFETDLVEMDDKDIEIDITKL